MAVSQTSYYSLPDSALSFQWHRRQQRAKPQPTRLRIVLPDVTQNRESGSSPRVWHPAERIKGQLELVTATERSFNLSVYFEGSVNLAFSV